MIAKCLMLAMSISLVHGNVWAQTRNSPMLQNQVKATASNAEEFIGGQEEEEITNDKDLATDSNAKWKILVEDLALLTDPVPYEEITLEGRKFHTIASTVQVPYYYVLKYSVPEGKGGSYTIEGKIVDDWYGSCTFYLCSEEQYEALCHRIETRGGPVHASVPTECLASNNSSSVNYWLEEGQDYYIVSTQYRSDHDGPYNLALTLDIDVNLDCSDATSTGTQALYSKGSEWCDSSRREWPERSITRPEKTGYRFEGYYTAKNGLGTQVIDDQGEILSEMSELAEDCTVYAFWTLFSPVSYQDIKLEGRRFSRIVSGGEPPYYQAFKFTVPEGSGGSYSFYEPHGKGYIDASGYLCTSEQYERLCHKIEQNKRSIFAPSSTDCLISDYYTFSINYILEAGKDYYFIAARNRDNEGDFKVAFERDIRITLTASDADYPGTATVYSKGGYWVEPGNSHWGMTMINRPERDGYKFAGYFTEENGQGIKVIDYDGELLEALADLHTDTTVYAHWENFSAVTYEDILLVDGRFTISGIAEKAPYYKTLKFKVPENSGGYYSFYYSSDEDINMSGYLCTPFQYEALCRKIEADGGAPIGLNKQEYYLVGDRSYFNITYQLESGQEYYFVATRESKKYYGEGEYQLLFRRDIEVELEAAEADYQGTLVLYSKGDRWSMYEKRWQETDFINTPRREDYLFAGYFTEKNGQGKMVIDQDGYIFHENMHEFRDNTTIYALWEDKYLEFKTKHLVNGVKGVLYKQKLDISSKMTFNWLVSEGELPEGLYLDFFDGIIIGRPTETGIKKIEITASNSQIKVSKEFTITINESAHSDSDERHSGNWLVDEAGNWRYYITGSIYYSNQWKFLEYNGKFNWYFFGSDGYVNTGWFEDNNGKWYYLNPVSDGTRGAMQTGWLVDPQDGNRYFLDTKTGQMALGWVCIDGIWYYFKESREDYSGWKWDAVSGGWQYENIGRRPMGALEPDKRREE